MSNERQNKRIIPTLHHFLPLFYTIVDNLHFSGVIVNFLMTNGKSWIFGSRGYILYESLAPKRSRTLHFILCPESHQLIKNLIQL